MKYRNLALAIASAALTVIGAAVPANAANLIVNGSFEAVPFNGSGSGYTLGLTNADVPGWTIPSSDGTYPWGLENANAYSAGPAADGNQWIVLGEVNSAVDFTIQQTVTGLTAGNTYNVTFDIASELGCCAVGEVSMLSGSSTGAQDFTAPSSGSYWTQWGLNTYSFVATAGSATIQFKDLAINGTGYDLGLDNVQLLTGGVPEPSTWAMLLVGFAGIGFAARRRIMKAA